MYACRYTAQNRFITFKGLLAMSLVLILTILRSISFFTRQYSIPCSKLVARQPFAPIERGGQAKWLTNILTNCKVFLFSTIYIYVSSSTILYYILFSFSTVHTFRLPRAAQQPFLFNSSSTFITAVQDLAFFLVLLLKNIRGKLKKIRLIKASIQETQVR